MRPSFRTIVTITAIPLAGMAVFFFWQWIHGGITPPEVAREIPRALKKQPVAQPDAVPPPDTPDAPPRPRQAARPGKSSEMAIPAGEGGLLVLIIDDLGFDGQPLERVMALDPNVSCSILPNGTRAAEFAERLHAAGFEILCHLPMQPRGAERPGRNAILTSMSDEEIARATRESVDAVPNARGVNNHMGSLATADRRVMEGVLAAMPAGMYFIDSRTTGRSVAAAVAREKGIPNATRDVFLDDTPTRAFVRRQLAELAATARRRGVAVGIGHPYPATLDVLEEEIPRLRAAGFRIVRAGEAVH